MYICFINEELSLQQNKRKAVSPETSDTQDILCNKYDSFTSSHVDVSCKENLCKGSEPTSRKRKQLQSDQLVCDNNIDTCIDEKYLPTSKDNSLNLKSKNELIGLKTPSTFCENAISERTETRPEQITIKSNPTLANSKLLFNNQFFPLVVNNKVKSITRCFKCKEFGHYARNCPGVKCYRCGNRGHYTYNCKGENFQFGN